MAPNLHAVDQAAPRLSRSCGTCIYFQADAALGGNGLCRYYPPATAPSGINRWAVVQPIDWCGVWTDTDPDIHPPLHHLTHQSGGTDEVNVAGLRGQLADPQPPLQLAATGLLAPANPPGTSNLTDTMMGLGSSFTITPIMFGRLHVIISGVVANSGANNGMQMTGRYGTGTPPANAAASIGAAFTGTMHLSTKTASEQKGFSLVGGISGAAKGVPIWLDVAIAAVIGGTVSLTDVQFVAFEL